jgi:glycosyltransferase involved in cell wall biosynthesis
VVFNQGAYQTFLHVTPEIQQLVAPYCHPDFVATIAVSEDSRRYLQFVFPKHPVFRIYNAVDPALFRYEPNKKRQIAFMMNRKKADVTQVVRILRFRKSLDGFETAAITDKTEAETARILRESQIFLSFCSSEGSPMPPLEALACGCITIGYHGRGGMEYLNDQYAFPVEAEDVIGFVETVERIIAELRDNPQPLLEKARRASVFVHETYSPQREERGIVETWEQILRLAAGSHTDQPAY